MEEDKRVIEKGKKQFLSHSPMEDAGDPLLCFPNLNTSCRRLSLPLSEGAVYQTLLASASLLTVTLNLLVVISISHFRQLHTPTNALLLSLAVTDLLVGLLVMPIEGLRYIETCWLLGRLLCALTPYVSYCLLSVSVGSMVLISIDRYLAICDPLLYSSKINLTRAKLSICLCWACSLLYNGCILMSHLNQPDRFVTCHGECVIVISHISGTVDLFITFFGPCTVMIVLYMRVFGVVLSQLQVIRMQTAVAATAATTIKGRPTIKRSERKAARTLGVVIFVFLLCFCPYYYPVLAGSSTSNSITYFAVLSWIMMLNSCANPLIYAIFYPWFRKAVKLIVTLRIMQSHSRETNIM